MLPPPRTTSRTSTPWRAPGWTAAAIASTMRAGASCPWTGVGKTISVDVRRATGQRRQDVAQRRRLQRRDDPDRPRMRRQRALSRRVEEPEPLERLLDPQERLVERAGAGAAQLLDLQLELAARRVQAGQHPRVDAVAVARRPVEALVAAPEHHAADLGVAVLQREVPVAGAGAHHVRDLAGHPDEREAALERRRDATDELPHRDDARRRRPIDRCSASIHAGFKGFWFGNARPPGILSTRSTGPHTATAGDVPWEELVKAL